MKPPILNEPTEAQIKELWEWCGLQEEIYQESHVWYDSQGRWVYQGYELTYPPIDLNNLWRYAVPKLAWYSISIIDDGSGKMLVLVCVQLKAGDKPRTAINKDLAPALFWAIWEVIHGE